MLQKYFVCVNPKEIQIVIQNTLYPYFLSSRRGRGQTLQKLHVRSLKMRKNSPLNDYIIVSLCFILFYFYIDALLTFSPQSFPKLFFAIQYGKSAPPYPENEQKKKFAL